MKIRILFVLLAASASAFSVELRDLRIGKFAPGKVYSSIEEFKLEAPVRILYNRPSEDDLVSFARTESGEKIALRTWGWPGNLPLPTPLDLAPGNHWLPKTEWPQGVNLKIVAVTGSELTIDGSVVASHGVSYSSIFELLGDDYEGSNGFFTWRQDALFLRTTPIAGEQERVACFDLGFREGWAP